MPGRAPLSVSEREHIYRSKLAVSTLAEIATELNCSVETVRKWWRTARARGRLALSDTKRGRAATGLLSSFAPAVIAQALALKRSNPRWGSARVRVALARDPALVQCALPSRSR
jgi:transposase-like protein